VVDKKCILDLMGREKTEFKIIQMYVYPVKGLPGVKVQSSIMDEYGMRFDRHCILLNEDGEMLTRRNTQGMADFKIEIKGDFFSIYSKRLGTEVEVMLDSAGKPVEISVWDRIEVGRRVGEVFDEFMSDHFGKKVCGYQISKGAERAGFHDSAPILICNLTSIKKVEALENQEIGIMRFRPNLVVESLEAFEEINWDSIMIGSVNCMRSKLCSRCIVINQNPESGEDDKNVLKLLRPFSPEANKVQFGVYYRPEGVVQVSSGDHIIINYK